MVRFKSRYLLVEFTFPVDNQGNPVRPPSMNEGMLHGIIRESLAANFGDIGWAQVGSTLHIKYLSQVTSLAIVRCSRATAPTVWAAITLIRAIKGVECCATVVHIGGTIRKTQQAAIVHDRRLIMELDRAGTDKTPSQTAQMQIMQSQQAIQALET